ncbi:Rossmann-like and DUF2520 domain-containing protein [Actinomycetospora straminea]|uniref:DUF2520 domain-containing protein n=1 Tax=Actinomycetospora straminea TaxID=663607 RepID=A0ABP9EDW8_9PSEU|nr:DUF2520 domain-containing protein [Actinomycetospora straminea]MDD7931874.1 DUF2520 domain-containing protein [Actinomycetospora straminea]
MGTDAGEDAGRWEQTSGEPGPSPTPREGSRLAVGVVSAGRVGAVLGAALAQAGHQVVAASAVSRASRARAEELLPGAAILPPDEVVRRADLALLAVPDDVLPGLVRGLAASDCLRPGQIVVHTCGAAGVGVLAPAAEHDVLPIALHPAMTITGRREDVARLTGACVGVTGPEPTTEDADAAWLVGEALVVEMGAEPVRVPEAVRPLYHAALAHGANHLVTLVREAADLLAGAGVEPAERVLAPLLSAALDNALRHGDRALTGPVVRGDAGTVAMHLRHLDDRAPAAAPLYRALARRTAERARDGGLVDPAAAADVVAALERHSP